MATTKGIAPAYIAMLRGINVSGHKIIPMARLRASFEGLGFRNVKTYVQSGNVVFEAPKVAADGLAEKIERKLARDFGFAIPVFLNTSKQMAAIIRRNPFPSDRAIDTSKLHVTFLSGAPPKTAREILRPLAAASEQFRVGSRVIYLYCPDGYGRTKLSNVAIEKKLSVGATTRNWKTTNLLLAMAAGNPEQTATVKL